MPQDKPTYSKFELWERMIYKLTGDDFFFYPEARGLIKFGRNPDIGIDEGTVMGLISGQIKETYLADGVNGITHFSTISSKH